ncbi:ribonuclease domain-containing protein [Streptomyces sp. yr375]|uniref:ribonuclease domain-containing protein n=1 Tax=Streptomyces sp. yr375 TaxID=1761906 RepID=UPI000B8A5A12|nr:ribonuclease domain-containing protein [Streptomyces sp. yr375]
MLLGLAVGSLTVGGAFSALVQAADACENGACQRSATRCPAKPPARGRQPPQVSDQQWRGALGAADFWNAQFPGRAWPGGKDPHTRGWYHFESGSRPGRQRHVIYYGGVFPDREHRVQRLEESRHVPANQASGANDVYREYDVNAQAGHTGPRGGERIVRNVRTHHVYATFDHCGSFHYLGHW